MARVLIYYSLNSMEAVQVHAISKDWSDCADLRLCWPHKSYLRFCHALAHFFPQNCAVSKLTNAADLNFYGEQKKLISILSSNNLQHVLCKMTNIFFLFSQKIGFDISCKLSPNKTICIKYQSLFLAKIRKMLSICRLLNYPKEWCRLRIKGHHPCVPI